MNTKQKKKEKEFIVSFTATGHGTVVVDAVDAEDARKRALKGEGRYETLLEWEYDEFTAAEPNE